MFYAGKSLSPIFQPPLRRPLLITALTLVMLLLPFIAREAERDEPLDEAVRLILRSKLLSKAEVAIHAVSLRDGRELFTLNPDTSLVPASNMKILTAAAALWALKPDFRFSTPFLTSGRLQNGVLDGNLYVRGSGAPDLVVENMWLIARELHHRGLNRVKGALVADDSYFDGNQRAAGWKRSYSNRAFAAPVGAISCNFNSLNVICRPGPQPGSKLTVILDPFSSFFDVRNQTTTRKGRATLKVDRRYVDGRNQVLVNGSLAPGAELSTTLCSVEDPTGYFLSAFVEVAEQVGILFDEPPRRGEVPSGAREFYAFESKPLSQILVGMNKYSTNFTAEMLFRAMGAEVLEPPGNTVKGGRVVDLFLARIGARREGVSVHDGSGLSPLNRVTARSLVAALRYLWEDFGTGPEFFASLPIAGADGTLEKRMKDESTTRRVRAKSGFINSASTLSGIADNPIEGPIAFSILMNGFGGGNGDAKQLQDRICRALVSRRAGHEN